MKPDYKLVAKAKYIHMTADLASEVWHEVYKRYFAWKMENTSLHLLHLYLKPEYRGKAIGRDIVASCERLARGEGRGRVWCGVNAKALPVQQFFKALRYRELRPAEQETGTVPRNELVYEHTLS